MSPVHFPVNGACRSPTQRKVYEQQDIERPVTGLAQTTVSTAVSCPSTPSGAIAEPIAGRVRAWLRERQRKKAEKRRKEEERQDNMRRESTSQLELRSLRCNSQVERAGA